MTCELAAKNTTTECSDQPEMFRTTVKQGGRIRIECLNHAIRSEEQGKQVEVIRN